MRRPVFPEPRFLDFRQRLREWLLGGVTYELLHESPVPVVVAH